MAYFPGKWLAVCDVCGWEYYNDELMERWDGLRVCKKDWEPRHPMDFLRTSPEESQHLPWTRPEPADTFIDVPYIFDDALYWELDYTVDDPLFAVYYITPSLLP